MAVSFHWRGDFDNAEVNELHADAFGHRVLEDDWQAQVHQHSLGWVCARDGARLVGGPLVAERPHRPAASAMAATMFG